MLARQSRNDDTTNDGWYCRFSSPADLEMSLDVKSARIILRREG